MIKTLGIEPRLALTATILTTEHRVLVAKVRGPPGGSLPDHSLTKYISSGIIDQSVSSS